MTYVQLEYLVAVETYGSFSKAAKKCFVTQPTLSMQVQKLEEELGVVIFDRSKMPLKTTSIGKKIIKQAKLNLMSMRKMKEIIQDEKQTIEGELRVGIIPTLGPYLLPLFVSRFLKKYPLVQLSIEEIISEQVVEKLKSDQLDVGILVTPIGDNSISEVPLFYETFVAYVSTSHHLFREDFIKLNELNLEEMLLLSEGHCFRNQVINICPESDIYESKYQLKFESGSLETLMRIIEKGYGYTLIPELAGKNLPAKKTKYLKKLTYPNPVREVSLVTHRDLLKQNLINKLKEEIILNLPEELKSKKEGKVIGWK